MEFAVQTQFKSISTVSFPAKEELKLIIIKRCILHNKSHKMLPFNHRDVPHIQYKQQQETHLQRCQRGPHDKFYLKSIHFYYNMLTYIIKFFQIK